MRLDDVLSLGPGALVMFATCLVIVRGVSSTVTKMPKITQAEGKQLLKFVYMFLLEQVLDDTDMRRSLVSALACTLNHYGLEAVAENLFDVHDVQVYLCIANVLWSSYPKVVQQAVRLSGVWCSIVHDCWPAWPNHDVEFGALNVLQFPLP